MKNVAIIIILSFVGLLASAQNRYVDSLKLEVESEFEPGKKLILLTELSNTYLDVNEVTSLYYAGEVLKIASALEDDIEIGKAYQLVAYVNFSFGKQQVALREAKKAITYFEKNNEHKLLGDLYIFIESIYDQIGEYPNSLIMAQKALVEYEIISDTLGQAAAYNDIGVVHYYSQKYEIALEYTNKSYELYKLVNDSSGIGSCFNNLANVYWGLGDEELSLEYYQKGYEIDVAIGDFEGQATSLYNIGEVYVILEKYVEAEETFLRVYELSDSIGDKWLKTYALRGLASLFSYQGKYSKALVYAKESVKLSKDIGAAAEVSESYYVISDIYKQSEKYKEALEYFEKYYNMEDTIFNIENASIINEMEAKFQTDKMSTENELLKQKGELTELKVHEEKQRNLYLNIGLGLILIISGVILWSLFAKQKANKKLKGQKDLIQEKNERLHVAFSEIEEKNKEITASISYAKRIQSAILPDNKLVDSYLKESFILYKPKDIVAGDFYWMDVVGKTVLFAAADCTGHGVPGAMVSVVCNNALNRAVREFGLVKPSDILDKVTDLVIEQFEKSDEDVKDGMDIALCSLNGNILEYSGANNPLWIVRNGELLETRPVKQPVGKFDSREPFMNHVLELEEADTIYIFSDGYIDQFGGPKGKKLKAKPFRELLSTFQDESMESQKRLLNDQFENWRGDLEQIDDVCIIGVRV